MGYFLRNFHILVFALISVVAALWVGVDPERTVRMMEPVIEDAVELGQMAEAVYVSVETINWEASAREAMAFYIAALRMPSMVYARIDRKLAEVNQHLREIGALQGHQVPVRKISAQEALAVFRDFKS